MDHAQLEARIAEYMINAGCAPALTEINIGAVLGVPDSVHRKRGRSRTPWWIADIAGLLRATPSRLMKLGLRRYCELARELDALGHGNEPAIWSWLIEVKVQRGDFSGDPKFNAIAEAHLQFVAYPDGLIEPDEVPDGWGGLEVHSRGVRKHTKGMVVNTLRPEQPTYLIAAVARALWFREGKDKIAKKDRRRKEGFPYVR